MTTTTQTMTLADFVSAGEDKLVLWYAAVGNPTGDYKALGLDPQYDDDAVGAWADLDGTVRDGHWTWDGRGDAGTDCRLNTVLRVECYRNERIWDGLYEELS